MVGRKPKPSNLKVLQGNPGKRPMPQNEVKPDATEPEVPAFLDPYGRKEWKRLAPTLVRLGLLTEVDGAAFAGYCDSYSTVRRLNIAIRKCKYKVLAEKTSFLETKGQDNGRTNEVKAVEAKINPLLIAKRNALQVLRFFCQEFGLTPSARGRINVAGLPEADPMDRFLRGPGKD